MIEVEHVSRDFGTFRAVDDISFSIQTGEIVGLLGPNGAGKSTTMRMITGYLNMTSGNIKIDGKDITENPKESKKKIGYMPESAPLYGDMIVEDYLRYVAEMQYQDPEKKIPLLAAECGLKEVMHKNINELSRGYRQRVGLAHSLMNDPEILILDEPTSGLDPNQIGDVRNLIKEIGKTRTVIISTHILGEVEMLCDRVIIIAHGKIAADSPTSELRSRYGHAASVHVAVSGCDFENMKKALEQIPQVVAVTKENEETVSYNSNEIQLTGAVLSLSSDIEIRPDIFAIAVKKGWTVYAMDIRRNSLEDVFRTLTMGGDNNEK